MTLRIKNWDRFQHYHNRKPPWIKLYRELLDDPDYHKLPPVAAKYLPLIWLVASEKDGELPDLTTLSFRLRLDEKKTIDIIKQLEDWVHDASNVLADCKQLAIPEREKEREKERESKTYSSNFNTFWSTYPKKNNKKAAYREWKKATDKPDIGTIIAKLTEQIEAKQKLKQAGVFTPEFQDPQRWIKNERWNDVPEVVQTTTTKIKYDG